MESGGTATAADIDGCKYLYLIGIGEPRDNRLRLVVQEARTGTPAPMPTQLGLPLASSYGRIVPNGRKFEILWDHYLAYGVRNESHVAIDPYEVRVGRIWVVYSKSRYLDYLALACHTHELCGHPLTHWGVNCLNHIVDVVGPHHPRICLLE